MGRSQNRPISLAHAVRQAGAESLNQILADTMTCGIYTRSTTGRFRVRRFINSTCCLTKHFAEQAELVDALAERVQTLGGVAIAMAHGCGGDDARQPAAKGSGRRRNAVCFPAVAGSRVNHRGNSRGGARSSFERDDGNQRLAGQPGP